MFNIKISQKTKIYVLLLIVAALSVSYIMNKQISAVLSLLLLSGLAYALSKNIIMSLAISIIITNLLLSMNYFVVEGLQGSQSLTGDLKGAPNNIIPQLQAVVNKHNENDKIYKQ
jgi:hypothetical protein